LAFFSTGDNPVFAILKLIGYFALNALALLMIYGFIYNNVLSLAIVIVIITVFANLVIFVPALYPLKWMAPGLMLVTLLVLFPIYYTVTTSFTNYGDGHLFSKESATSLIVDRGYVPDDAQTYIFTPFTSGEDQYALWLTNEDGTLLFAEPGQGFQQISLPEQFGVTPQEEGAPQVEGFQTVDDPENVLAEIETLEFNDPVEVVRIAPVNLDLEYLYDIDEALVLEQSSGDTFEVTFFANESEEIGLWLTEISGLGEVDEALYYLPGGGLEEIDLEENETELESLAIDLPTGATIPRSIAGFERIADPFSREETLRNIEIEEIGLQGTSVNLDEPFVYDPAQGITFDYAEGEEYETTILQNDAGEISFYMDAGRTGTYLLLPDGTTFVDGVPTEFEGFDQVVGRVERNQALSFLQGIDFEYFGEGGDTLGIVDINRAGRPYLRRFVYNEPEDAFIDLSSITASELLQTDGDTVTVSELGLDTADLFTQEGLVTATLYDANDEIGEFEPRRLRFVYNEAEDAYLDLFSVDIRNPMSLSGERIVTTPALPSIGINGARFYQNFEAQNVFAQQGYIYNESASAFIDPGSADASAEDLASADLATLSEIEGATVFVLNEATDLYVPQNYVYNEPSDQFIDPDSSEITPADLSGVDLSVASIEALEAIGTATPYYTFDDDPANAFVPADYVYNASENVFIDISSVDGDVTAETVATADISGDAYEDADIYTLDEATGLYTLPQFVYNEVQGAYVDSEDLALEGVDLATADLFEIEGLEEIPTFISLDEIQGDFVYDQDTPVFNETLDAYLYLPEITLDGIELATVDPAVLATAAEEYRLLSAQPNLIGNFVYYSTVEFPDTVGENYVLATPPRADELSPGYRVNIGLANFTQLAEDSTLLEPLIQIALWTFAFALLSVLTTFAVGLFMALILKDAMLPGKKIIRSLLIIPYAVPGVIAILVWQGMLNENLGIITQTMADWFNISIPWFSNGTWAKVAILLVNLWLGYPYMMLICSGALSAIPSDVYEAAAVDGASPWQRFWNITLPLLLITVGPLLIASFTFNFNNYLIIEALTGGDPPIPGTSTPAGQTDILINYVYNLAFGSGQGADYGYASAITIVIFFIVALITLFQFRFTKQWEEVGESV